MTAPETITASGRTATVTVTGNLVTITPTTLAKVAGRRGVVQLRTDSIVGVQFSPAHFGTLGFLRLVTVGAPATIDRQAAQQDPYTVLFTRRAMGDFEAVREAVLRRITGT